MLKSFLIADLHVGIDFWKHIQGKDPSILADVLAQAESLKVVKRSLIENKKTDVQENQKGKEKRRDRSQSDDYCRNVRSPTQVNATSTRREWSPPSSYDGRHGSYTPLVASSEHIIQVNKNNGYFESKTHYQH